MVEEIGGVYFLLDEPRVVRFDRNTVRNLNHFEIHRIIYERASRVQKEDAMKHVARYPLLTVDKHDQLIRPLFLTSGVPILTSRETLMELPFSKCLPGINTLKFFREERREYRATVAREPTSRELSTRVQHDEQYSYNSISMTRELSISPISRKYRDSRQRAKMFIEPLGIYHGHDVTNENVNGSIEFFLPNVFTLHWFASLKFSSNKIDS